MPLAGAIAINFSAPLWSALLSVIWLKERAGPARWGVLLFGFCGVLIVTHPGTDSLQVGALFALANAIMYGSVTVAVRGMTKTESSDTLLMWQMVTIAVFHAFLLVFGVKQPSPADAAMLVASGVWDTKKMVNVEELDPEPFIEILDRIGLPTEIKEIKPDSKHSFDGTVRSLEKELSESTATVTISAANPMIALSSGKPAKSSHLKDKSGSGKEKKPHKKSGK